MAVAKFGSIITDMRGSVGGTTFRKINGVNQVYNKTSGASKSRIPITPGFSYLQKINNDWRALSNSDRLLWSNEATKFFRTDKFGNQIAYTGRQFYTAVMYNNFHTGDNVTDPTIVRGSVAVPDFFVEMTTFFQNFIIQVTAVYEDTWGLVQVKQLSSESSSFTLGRSQILGVKRLTATGNQSVVGVNTKLGYDWKAGDIFGYSISFVNDFGWRSPQVSGKVIVQ